MNIQINKLTRSKRKTIALIIERDGALNVRAPMRAPLYLIDEFIQQKADWITRTREKIKSAPPTQSRQYQNGENFPYLGSTFALDLIDQQRTPLQLNNRFTLRRSAQNKAEALFTRWYKERAYEIISERVKQYAAQHGFNPAQVKINSAKTRWGSCSTAGSLNFTWRLVMAPLDVIDYVVVHELVHLKIKNHSPKFWKAVEDIYPDYKIKRKWLRENGEKLTL